MPRTAIVRPLRACWELAPLVPAGVVVLPAGTVVLPIGVAVVVIAASVGVIVGVIVSKPAETTITTEVEGTAEEDEF